MSTKTLDKAKEEELLTLNLLDNLKSLIDSALCGSIRMLTFDTLSLQYILNLVNSVSYLDTYK